MRAVWIGLTLLVVLAIGGWQFYERVLREAALPAPVLAAEQALAAPGVIGLATLDVATGASLAGLPDGAFAWLGLDLESLSHTVAAVHRSRSGRPGFAIALLGSFDPSRIEARLRERSDLRLREGELAGERVLFATRADPDRCAEDDDWGVWLEHDRVLFADSESFGDLVQRWRSAAPASLDLARFRARRSGALASLALFVPEALPLEGSQPFLRAALERGHAALGGVDAIYATLRAGAFPAGPRIEADLVARDRARLAAELRAWLGRQAESQAQWASFAPALADLLAGVELEEASDALQVRAALDAELLGNLSGLPAQLLIMASRALDATQVPAGADQIDLAPSMFRAHYRPSALPHYDSEIPLAGAVDAESGPFGLRVLQARASASGQRGLELEVEVLGPALRGLGERSPGPLLQVESALDGDGAELLRDEPCGPDRNSAAVPLAGGVASELIRARKTLRLADAVELDALAALRAVVRFTLPVRTESLRIENPVVGDAVEHSGSRVEITGLSGSAFSYRISGAPERVLAVRALNRVATPLAALDSWFMDVPGRDELVAAESYHGELAELEIVFALEQQELSFPLELDSARPGSNGEELSSESAAFIEYSEQQFIEEFAPLVGKPFEPERPGHALGTAGPFTLVLRELGDEGRLAPQIGVLAPDIPNLTYNLHGLELELEEVRLRDGRTASTDVRAAVLPRRSFGRDELVGSVELDTGLEHPADAVLGVAGTLRLRLARNVQSARLERLVPGERIDAWGVALEVLELGRDHLTLSLEGRAERLVALRAFNESGQELLIEDVAIDRDEAGAQVSLTIHGQPRAVDVQLATDAKRFAYDFRLDLPAAIPAAPAP